MKKIKCPKVEKLCNKLDSLKKPQNCEYYSYWEAVADCQNIIEKYCKSNKRINS